MNKIEKLDFLNDVRVIIPTRGRVDEQLTLQNLHPIFRKFVTICCHPGKINSHIENWGESVYDIMEYSKNFKNIGEIRQWCVEYFEEPYIIFIDDNICIDARSENDFGDKRKFPLYRISSTYFTEENILELTHKLFYQLVEKLKSNE